MFTTPEDTQGQNVSEAILNEDNHFHRTLLYIGGVFLVIVVLWGAAQMRNTNSAPFVDVVAPVETVLTEEEKISRELDTLAAESGNQPPATEEEVKAQLEMLAADESDTPAPTTEEVFAELEALQAKPVSN